MEWWLTLIILLGALVLLLMTKFPVAFCFLVLDLVGAVFILGGAQGLHLMVHNLSEAVCSFSLICIPLFILMGEILYHSGLAERAINAMDKLLGRLPGRLSLLIVVVSTIFAALSGSGFANVALLGVAVAPEMRRRAYHNTLIMGPILAGGCLAVLIPPSSMIIVLGVLAEKSIGLLLIAGIIPGVVLSFLFIVYIIVVCKLNPSLAPPYEVERRPVLEKIISLSRDVLPLGLIFFLAVVVIFLGVCTPSEASALGALASIVIAVAHRKFSLELMRRAVEAALGVSGMIFMIMVGAKAFSQILAFTGATGGMIQMVVGLKGSPLLIIIAMQLVILFLGCFINEVPILMLCIPMFMPIVDALGIDPIWWGIVTIICANLGAITPPFGQYLFVMQSVSPREVTMADIYRASLPFTILQLIGVALFLAVPKIITFLPSLMG